ncbi:MAG: FAD-dependent oxidoreductase [Corynebacteriales bacterium]|nr:FAD-dependent oxidoreductase [Mycobacteriales bacterium]
MNKNTRIVILGAGYTGMLAAVRLAHRTRRLGTRITLVNANERFAERLRMHQVAAGHKLGDYRIPEILAGTGVEFVRGWATHIDPARRRITVATHAPEPTLLTYDTLVYALGSSTDTSIVPGATEHAFTLNGQHASQEIAARLPDLAAQGGNLTVCGGGLTGIEVATEIAENNPGLNVTLLSRDVPGAMMGEKARAYLHRAMDRLGVATRVGAVVARVQPATVELASGEILPSDLTIWTAGVRVSQLATTSGITTDSRGLIVVDAGLRSVSHPNIYAIGDAAAIRLAWGQIHGTCQSGMPSAQYVADAITRHLRGKNVKPFRYGYWHQPVSIGRKDAVIQFTFADDRPRRIYLKGKWAIWYKEMVSSSPLKLYRYSKHINVSATLSKGGRLTRTPATAQ